MKKIPKAKTYLLAASGGLLITILAGCGGPAPDHGVSAKGGIAVSATVLHPTAVGVYAHAIGTVVSADRVEVSSRLMGYIRTMNVHVGETVSPHQLLFQVDPVSVHAQIKQAKAQLDQAQAAYSAAESTYQRYAPLLKTGAVAPQEFDRIKASRNAARAAVTAAKSGLVAAQSQLDYARVLAPVSGVVVRKSANKGDLAIPGHPVLVLDNPNHRQVQFSVITTVYRKMRLGEPVTVSDDGQREPAHVERMVEAVDPVTHAHLIKASLSSSSKFPVGAFVTVAIQIGMQKVVLVPRSAIHIRAGLRGVFVTTDHDRAEFRLVRTGADYGNQVAILSGLAPGEHLVINSSRPLHNGELLHVIGQR